MRWVLVVLLALVMVAQGCGGDDDDAATTATTLGAADDATTTPTPTTTPGGDFDVVFDGDQCTVTGPSSLPAGTYTFVLTDNIDRSHVELWVREYVDGHTQQDDVDLQDAAGGPSVEISKPPWVVNTRVVYDVPRLDLAANQKQYSSALEPGPHGMNIGAASPQGQLWFCFPTFEVT